MDFNAFEKKFGGSFRNKYIYGAFINMLPSVKTTIYRLAKRDFKNAFAPYARPHNLRSYKKNFLSPLGRGFIRLCPWEADYLYSIGSLSRKGILEIGRFQGGSTFLLRASAPENTTVHSIDIAPIDDRNLVRVLNKFGLNKLLNLYIDDSTTTEIHCQFEYDVLWIDGDHSYEGCLSDLRRFTPRLASGGHILLHDAYCGSPVFNAINTFIAENKDIKPINNIFKPSHHWTDPHGSIAHLIKG